MKQLHTSVLLCVLGLFSLASVQAQQAQTPELRLQQLISDLQVQIQRAERERLADPWFIKDLQQLIGQYDNPWQRQLLFDDFSARGPAPAAPWSVESGEFLIDWRFGLRSVISPATSSASSTTEKKKGKEDLAAALLGAFLNQALEGDDAKQETAKPAEAELASVNALLALPNAFAIDLQFTSRDLNGKQLGHLAFGPYQANSNRPGYRLHYYNGTASGEASLSLNRVSSRGGESILDLYAEPLNLIDGNTHTIRWTRDTQGQMSVSLDGKAVFEVKDRSYRDAFDGLVIENHAGDFAIRQIEVHGAR